MKHFIASIALLLAGGLFGAIGYHNFHKPEERIVEVQITSELTGWQLLQMAIIKTESEFDSQAIGKTNDVGIFQITPIYVREVNNILDSTVFTHTDAFDVEKSIAMFNIIQEAKNPHHDIERAINLHNPGGDSIGYADKVLKNFRYLSRMEEIRTAITK